MGVVVSSSHIVSATRSSSAGGLLTLFLCFIMGSLPRETVLHKLLQYESFLWDVVLHRLLQQEFFPRAAVLQEQMAPLRVPHGVTSTDSKHASAWAPLSPQVYRSRRSLIQCRLSTGSQPPSGIPLLQHEVLHRLQVEICSTVDFCRLQGDNLPHHGLLHRLQGNRCSSGSSSFLTDLGVCRVVSLTYSHCSIPLQFFVLLLKYAIIQALPLSLMGSALASGVSILEPAGIGFIRHRGNF